jgi:xanthine/uracil permease
MQAQDNRPLGDLFGDLGKQLSTLIRQEIQLARTELSDTAGKLGRSLLSLVAGGLIAYSGLLVLLAAAVLGLVALGIDLWLSALVVGLVVIAIGTYLVRAGLEAVRTTNLAPTETVETMKDNIEAIKEAK